MAFGISYGGLSAEDKFLQLTGATRWPRSSEGDAVLEGHLVEVKRATTNTLNQVRALKYLPIVVHYEPTDTWFVIPAHVVVARVARRRRGQHTENPIESTTLSLSTLQGYKVSSDELRERTLAAIAASESYSELKDEMVGILLDSRALAQESRERVLATLARLDHVAVFTTNAPSWPAASHDSDKALAPRARPFSLTSP